MELWQILLLIGGGIALCAFAFLRAVNKSIDILLDEGFEAWERFWFSS